MRGRGRRWCDGWPSEIRWAVASGSSPLWQLGHCPQVEKRERAPSPPHRKQRCKRGLCDCCLSLVLVWVPPCRAFDSCSLHLRRLQLQLHVRSCVCVLVCTWVCVCGCVCLFVHGCAWSMALPHVSWLARFVLDRGPVDDGGTRLQCLRRKVEGLEVSSLILFRGRRRSA